MKTKMSLENVKWFEVIFKSGDVWSIENIMADTMECACKIADEMFGKGSWQYVVES